MKRVVARIVAPGSARVTCAGCSAVNEPDAVWWAVATVRPGNRIDTARYCAACAGGVA
jgi:hypothetical protein